MSFRLRLTLAVAGLAALAIAAVAVVSYYVTSDRLTGEIDSFLEAQAETLTRSVGRGRGGQRPPEILTVLPALRGTDTYVQVILADGERASRADDRAALPVSEADLTVASGDQDRNLQTVVVEGVDVRVLTRPFEVGQRQIGAVQIGRELTETQNVLQGLRRRLFVLGAAGTAVAALAAWALADSLTRPVRRLTRAAERVAATNELGGIDVEGSGEVGRLATSFNTMLGALETSRQQQRRLVMDASHELRTPLTSVRTNVDVLRRSPELELADREDVLADLDREVTELTDLVTELVDLATSSDRGSEPHVPLDLAALARDVAERAQRRTGRVIEVIHTGPVTVSGQRSGLERAISNLVNNACKFSPDRTPVTIEIDAGRVAVGDRGPGISAEDRPYVFDRFYRATATRDAPGSGLGLAIVEEVVRNLGGSVFVEDAAGGGAIVGFTFPAPDAP